MGWGSKAAKPQPVHTTAGVIAAASRGIPVPGDEPIPLEPSLAETMAEKPDPLRAAEVEFMRLQANKGWTAERRYDVLRDFIRKSGLYLELNKFVKGVR